MEKADRTVMKAIIKKGAIKSLVAHIKFSQSPEVILASLKALKPFYLIILDILKIVFLK